MKKISSPIVFFGNEKLATGIPDPQPAILEAVRNAGFTIEKVITGKLDELGAHDARIAVLAAYGRIIPQSVLDQFPLGIINVHPSLLPLYRGPTPIEQAILDGAVKTGVSIMHLTAGMDEGPIYKQKMVHLTGNETKSDLAAQLQQLGAELLLEFLPYIADGRLKPRNQPHPTRATYCSKIRKEDGILDWGKPAKQLEHEIRAYSGWPKSRTELAGKEVIITKARVLSLQGTAGTAKIIDKELVIFCNGDALVIDNIKPVGKTEMTGQAFIAGHKHLLEQSV